MIDLQNLALELAHATKTDTDQAILVAGQALAFWGAYYLDESHSLEALSPLTSKDIDFYERRKARVKQYISKVSEQLSNTSFKIKGVQYPAPEDPTIHTAILALEHPNHPNPILVDFIGSVDGLKNREVEMNSDNVTIGNASILILNPVFCLKARIHNLLYLYPRLGKSPERMNIEIQRVQLGLDIVKHHIVDVAHASDRKAANRANLIIGIAHRKMGRDLLNRHDINILDSLPKNTLNTKFYSIVLPDANRKLTRT